MNNILANLIKLIKKQSSMLEMESFFVRGLTRHSLNLLKASLKILFEAYSKKLMAVRPP